MKTILLFLENCDSNERKSLVSGSAKLFVFKIKLKVTRFHKQFRENEFSLIIIVKYIFGIFLFFSEFLLLIVG